MTNPFVVARLKAKPVEYAIRISHFVSGGEHQQSVAIEDLHIDAENLKRVAADLQWALDSITKQLAEWDAEA